MIRLITFSGKFRIPSGSHPAVDIENDAAARVYGRSQLILLCNRCWAGVMVKLVSWYGPRRTGGLPTFARSSTWTNDTGVRMPLQIAMTTPFADLDAHGLNLQADFDVQDLPADVRATLPVDSIAPFRQLLLVGNYGGALWQQLKSAEMAGEDPIDTFSRKHITAWLRRHMPKARFHVVYPGPQFIGLQQLGTLAGWHHPSPFMVGINAQWGSWFAYRAAVLLDADLPCTPLLTGHSPCESCVARPCVSSCPAGALSGSFNLSACLGYRQQPQSACRDRCLARNNCPVGEGDRYTDAQIAYHYGHSMAVIERLAKSAA